MFSSFLQSRLKTGLSAVMALLLIGLLSAQDPPTIITPDFMVNTNSAVANDLIHRNPSMVTLNDGRKLVLWEDNRTGLWTIYAQLIDTSGAPIGGNFQINTDGGTSGRFKPSAAGTTDGGFVVVWRDDRDGYHYSTSQMDNTASVYAQQYNTGGVPYGDNLRVGEGRSGGERFHRPFAVGTGDNGFTTIWRKDYEESDSEGWYLYSQLMSQALDSTGLIVGNQLVLAYSEVASVQSVFIMGSPPLQPHHDGGAIAAYYYFPDFPIGSYNYLRRFRAGLFEGPRVTVDSLPSTHSSEPMNLKPPGITSLNDSSYIVTWAVYDDTVSQIEILTQIYDSSLAVRGERIIVDLGPPGDNSSVSPRSIRLNDGGFITIWRKTVAGGTSDLYYRRFDSAGIAVDTTQYCCRLEESNPEMDLNILGEAEGGLSLTYSRDGDIFHRLIQLDGSDLVGEFKLNDDEGISTQTDPCIIPLVTGGYLIVWADNGTGSYDILARAFESEDRPIGEIFAVNDDTTGHQIRPAAAVAPDGKYLVVWEDRRHGFKDLYAQYFESDGSRLGPNFLVRDVEELHERKRPAAAFLANGKFVIGWEDHGFIKAQLYGSGGAANGETIRVSENASWQDSRGEDFDSPLNYPTIATSNRGGFTFAWKKYSDECCEPSWVYLNCLIQQFDEQANPIGSNRGIMPYWYTIQRDDGIALAYSGDGGHLLIYGKHRTSITAQFVDSAGVAVGSKIMVRDSTIIGQAMSIDVHRSDGGRYVIVWNETVDGNNEILARILSPLDSSLSDIFTVSREDVPSAQTRPKTTVIGNRMITVWMDNRLPGQPWNIYANSIDIGSLLEVKDQEISPQLFHTLSGYPNPFNPTVTIRFNLLSIEEVNLTVHDILGREVARLTSGRLPPGTHRAVWDGKDYYGRSLSSGIYIARLTTQEYSKSIKMLLLK